MVSKAGIANWSTIPLLTMMWLTRRVAGLIDPDMLVDIEPLMIAEDFSYYQEKVPGTFMFLGCRNEDKGFTFPLHSSKFNFDEEVLLLGYRYM